MPDTKITALTAIGANPIIPSTFPIPMVDLTDTSMAASGTTKKVTVNQILGAGGTATLASATITGDLTVDTSTLKVDSANDRVGIGTATPGGALEVFKNTNGQNRLFLNNPSTGTGAYDSIDFTAGTANNQILSMSSGYSGSFPYLTGALLLRSAQANGIVLNTAGSAAAIQFGINDTLGMTLNATGLGVGVSPGSAIGNLQVGGSSNANLYVQQGTDTIRMGVRASGRTGIILDSSNATYTNRAWYLDNVGSSGSLIIGRQGLDVITFDNSGNCGIGVTPSAWVAGAKALQFGAYGALAQSSSGNIELSFNSYNSGAGAYKYLQNDTASLYRASSVHSWFTATSGLAGNGISFGDAKMTLDASGNLLVGTTVSPSGTKIGSIAKLGKVNIEGTNTVTVSTSAVALARAHDTGGLFFISGYNNVGGSQCWFLVAARGNTVTTIASDNNTGLTVSFTAPSSILSMNTTSGTLSVSCISMTNQSV